MGRRVRSGWLPEWLRIGPHISDSVRKDTDGKWTRKATSSPFDGSSWSSADRIDTGNKLTFVSCPTGTFRGCGFGWLSVHLHVIDLDSIHIHDCHQVASL